MQTQCSSHKHCILTFCMLCRVIGQEERSVCLSKRSKPRPQLSIVTPHLAGSLRTALPTLAAKPKAVKLQLALQVITCVEHIFVSMAADTTCIC